MPGPLPGANSAGAPSPRGGARVRNRATAIGVLAIVIWSSLALLTTRAAAIPPFQLVASAFAVAFFVGCLRWLRAGGPLHRHFQLSGLVWLIGVGGLFGNHLCYFLALRLAPPVQANLVNYLWPLLIVCFSAFLPGEPLRWRQIAGALAGFAGCALVITGGGRVSFASEHAWGYLAALGAAVTWAGYSILSRRVAHVPTDAVGAFCGATAVLALVCHLAFESTRAPQPLEWLAIVGLGLGPVGGAFFAWDHGVKHGDIRFLGVAAYAIPLMSTALLVAFGFARPSWILLASLLLIAGGGLIASMPAGSRTPRRPRRD